jgi:hypothetical protein
MRPTDILVREEFIDADVKYTETEFETQAQIHIGGCIMLELSACNNFKDPYIPIDKKTVDELTWNKEKIIVYRYRNPCECQIRQMAEVVIASVPFEDFMHIARESTISKFIENQQFNAFIARIASPIFRADRMGRSQESCS